MSEAGVSNSRRAAAEERAQVRPRKGPLVLLARVMLGSMTVILSVNLWTGIPLVALLVGSYCSGGNIVSMGGVAVVVVMLIALMTAGVLVLTRISSSYDRLTGRPPAIRQPAPWLLSMSASKVQPARKRRELNAIETIVVLSVVAAVFAFEFWFFFLASSTITG